MTSAVLLAFAGCYDEPVLQLDVTREGDVQLGVRICAADEIETGTTCQPNEVGSAYVFDGSETATQVHVVVTDATSTVLVKLQRVVLQGGVSPAPECATVAVGDGLVRIDVHVTPGELQWTCMDTCTRILQPVCDFE